MSTKIKVIIFLVFVFVFGYFCWYSYFVQIDNVHEHDIPLLRMQDDIKSKPEEPGGIEISNKDKTIYNEMLGKKRVESNVVVVEQQEKPVSKGTLEDLINKQLGINKWRKTLVVDPSQIEDSQAAPKKLYKPVPVPSDKYSIRVAKLKEKRFLSRGIEIFHKKYPSLRNFKGEYVDKNGNYYLHFVNIPSKAEAKKLCQILRDDDRNCDIYKQ